MAEQFDDSVHSKARAEFAALLKTMTFVRDLDDDDLSDVDMPVGLNDPKYAAFDVYLVPHIGRRWQRGAHVVYHFSADPTADYGIAKGLVDKIFARHGSGGWPSGFSPQCSFVKQFPMDRVLIIPCYHGDMIYLFGSGIECERDAKCAPAKCLTAVGLDIIDRAMTYKAIAELLREAE